MHLFLKMNSQHLAFERLKGRANFAEWKTGAKAYLISRGHWDSITTKLAEDATPTVKLANRKALAEMTLLLEPTLYSYIEEIVEAKDAWDSLLKIFEDKGAARKVTLLKQWISLKSNDCSSIYEYVNKSVSLRAKVKTAGFEIAEEIAGSILLCGLSDDYKPLIMSMEVKEDLTLDYVKNTLLQSVDFDGGDSATALSAQKQNKKKFNKNKKKVKCYDCGGPHYKNKCPKSNNKAEKGECVLYSAFVTREESDGEWLADSGATKHMAHDNLNLENVKKPTISEVKVANNERVKIKHVGDLKCTIGKSSSVVVLKDVQYIPDLCVNLLSVSQLVKNECVVIFDIKGCKIYKKDVLIATGLLIDDVFKFKIKTSEIACASSAKENNETILWHRRLAHTNFKTLNSLLNLKVQPDTKCVICVKGKQARTSFNDIGTRATKLLEIVHSDVCGPFPTRSLGGANYFVSFIDDLSRKVFIFALKSKGEVFSKFIEFKNRAENETDLKIKILRSDNGTEYVNKNFADYFMKHGIKHQKSAPYSPQQNGLAERMNRTIIEKVRCMSLDTKMSKHFWAEAVCAAADIINALPNASNNVPNDMWNKTPTDLSRFKVFGCRAMVWQPEQKRKKLDAKSYQCIFLRYADDAKAYRLYDTVAKKIVVSRDVVFMETERLVIDSNILNKDSNFIEIYEDDDCLEDLIETTSSNAELETIAPGENG